MHLGRLEKSSQGWFCELRYRGFPHLGSLVGIRLVQRLPGSRRIVRRRSSRSVCAAHLGGLESFGNARALGSHLLTGARRDPKVGVPAVVEVPLGLLLPRGSDRRGSFRLAARTLGLRRLPDE